jgi:hypothetical protein
MLSEKIKKMDEVSFFNQKDSLIKQIQAFEKENEELKQKITDDSTMYVKEIDNLKLQQAELGATISVILLAWNEDGVSEKNFKFWGKYASQKKLYRMGISKTWEQINANKHDQ